MMIDRAINETIVLAAGCFAITKLLITDHDYWHHSGQYTPLQLAAKAGSLDCVRELLARGADRIQGDASGRIPYMVAVKYKHDMCAALLNPLAQSLGLHR